MVNIVSDIVGLAKQLRIENVTDRAQCVTQGGAYVAIKGMRSHGGDFVQHAVNMGAKLIVLDDHEKYASVLHAIDQSAVFVALVTNARRSLSELVKYFYPVQPDCITGVVGTNGKTSVSVFYAQLALASGINCAAIGTLGTIFFNKVNEEFTCQHFEPDLLKLNYPNGITTPDAVILQKQMRSLVESGFLHAAIEMTSQGLDQYRVDHLDVKSIGFTNITQDHLDYHGTFANYFDAKKRAFTEVLSDQGVAVLNCGIDTFHTLFDACKMSKPNVKVLSYGKTIGDLHIVRYDGNAVVLSICGKQYSAKCQFPSMQIENLLCALGLGVANGLDIEKMVCSIPQISQPDGRLEMVAEYKNGKIYVDYAHTPDALRVLLQNLRYDLHQHDQYRLSQDSRAHAGKLYVLFGCGGQRDPSKRAIMGQIASDLVDHIIITDDNPRYEDPAVIRDAIASACDPSKTTVVVEGRAYAIRYAVSIMEEGGILVIAGKGPEQYQIIKDRVIYFSDKEEVRCILNAL